MNLKHLVSTVEGLFDNRSSLMSLWQEIAENFYPERADFTVSHSAGDEFAENLASGYPLLCRRDLGDQFGSMLRPSNKNWFQTVTDEHKMDNDAKRWLEFATGVQRRAMYDKRSMFTRAMKEGDHDYAAFGQTVPQVRLNREGNGLLFKTHHLRDMAWKEDDEGGFAIIARKWKATNLELRRIFGDKNHREVLSNVDKQPFDEVECYHIIVQSDLYDEKNPGNKPYFSIYWDRTHEHEIESMPVFNREYSIQRWQTVSGSQYAYSPATIIGLPDARLIQAMTYTLLEAGEKATNPPIVATEDAVRSDVSIYAGGITWVDSVYDERLGQALRPLTQDLSGIPIGSDMLNDERELLVRAFYLNKLSLPQPGGDMTAFETARRVEEYIRGALPLFEPMEFERNGDLCELTFDLMLRAGGFGPMDRIPDSLRGADIHFKFESPLHDAIEMQKASTFAQTAELLGTAMQLDPSLAQMVNSAEALRDTLNGLGVPAKWMNDESVVARAQQQHQQELQAQKMMAVAQQAAEVADTAPQGEVNAEAI